MAKMGVTAGTVATALVSLASVPAAAQDVPKPNANASQTSTGTQTPPARESDQGIRDIIVTAERRSESVQRSSLAISVMTPSVLKDAGVSQVRDLTKLEPGVQIGQGGPATQIYVRGVGDFGSTPVTNPAVAVNVDGVYVARANSVEGNFYDLERIEVLKGPQGTLYGRNASGGAINIITAKPRFDKLAGGLDVEIGNYSAISTQGYLNVPVNDKLALRGAFQVVSRNGYATQGFDDDHKQAFRLTALWRPTDNFSVRITGDHVHVGGIGPAYVFKGPLPGPVAAAVVAEGVSVPRGDRVSTTDPAFQQLYLAVSAAAGLCLPDDVRPFALTGSGPAEVPRGPQGSCPTGSSSLVNPPDRANGGVDNNFTNVAAEVTWKLGFATLTVLPAYRRVRNDYTTYPLTNYLNSPFGPERSDATSGEIRLSNSSPSLKWVAGLYYFREIQNVANTNAANGIIYGYSQNFARFVNESKAVFGQATVSVTPKLRLIAGARYSIDDRFLRGRNEVLTTPYVGFPFLPGGQCYGRGTATSPCVTDTFVGSKRFRAGTYKVGVEWDAGPSNMLFATYATGQKAGGFNQFSAASGAAGTTVAGYPGFYNPEKLAALEVGSRNRFLDNRLQVNLQAFYWRYRDAHESFTTTTAFGDVQFGYTNAGRARMFGADIDIVAKLGRHDVLKLSGEYLNAKFQRFVFQSLGLQQGISTGCNVTEPGPGQVFQTIDCSGKPLFRAPRLSGSASFTHSFEMTNGATLDATLTAQFATSRELSGDYIAASRAKGYVSPDFTATYQSADGKWSLGAFVRNFTDARVYTGAFAIPFYVPGVVAANIGAPRTYGMRASVNF